MSLAAGMLLFDNFVSHLFPVTVKIVAYIKHNVDFVSTAFDSQRGFGYLDFEKRLGESVVESVVRSIQLRIAL